MKIGLFGQFGTGNTGNDASLEAMLGFLRGALPHAELVCICSAPDRVRETFGVEAVYIGAEPQGRVFLLLNWVSRNVLRRLANLRQAYLVTGQLNALIIPGTGILDDFKEHPFGWPYVVFRWSIAARLAGVPLAFVSIGAGPIRNRISLWFMKTAAKCAAYRSYRDAISRHFMQRIGVRTDADDVFPDLAFRLAAPQLSEALDSDPRLSVGIGVMAYTGWFKNDTKKQEIYRQYRDKLVRFIRHLLARGYRVRLLIGDQEDCLAVDDVLHTLARAGEDTSRIVYDPADSLSDLKHQIAATDLVVASRFHNLIAALSLERPVISLAYAAKNDALLEDMGLGAYCNHVETFQVEELISQFDRLAGQLRATRAAIRWRLSRYHDRLAEQERRLLARVLAEPRRKPAHAAGRDYPADRKAYRFFRRSSR